MTANQQFCLRWNNYQTNLLQVFEQLLREESFVDVSLACEGHQIKAHRMVLSACSPYFSELLSESICNHPIIILQGVKWPELKAVVEFMYRGEINICQDQLGGLLKVAESLKIRGLADVDGEQAELSSPIPSPQGRIRPFPDDEPSLSAVLAAAARKRRRISGDDSRPNTPMTPNSGPEMLETSVDLPISIGSLSGRSSSSSGPQHHPLGSPLGPLAAHLPGHMPPPGPPLPGHLAHLPPLSPLLNMHPLSRHHAPDDYEIRPGIAEMIREEERRRRDQPDMAKLLESSHHWMSPTMADAVGGKGGSSTGGGAQAVFPSMFPEQLAATSPYNLHLQLHQEQWKQQPLASVASIPTSPKSSSGKTAKSPNTPINSTVTAPNTSANPVSEKSNHAIISLSLSTSLDSKIMTDNSSMSNANGDSKTVSPPSTCAGDQDHHLDITDEKDGCNDALLESLRGAAAVAAPKSGVSRWTQSDLLAALTLVQSGIPIKPAAERCNIPVMTLWRRTRALGIVSSKVQCGFRYPAARRRSRTEPDHSTRIKLMNQYAHTFNPDIEADMTHTNTSNANISTINPVPRSIGADLVDTKRFSANHTMPKIEDDSKIKMPYPYLKKEVPSIDRKSSTYNGNDLALYNAYRNRSPSLNIRDIHQSPFKKENSPFRNDRENSPYRQKNEKKNFISDRENSNVRLLKGNSPKPFCRENSPLHTVKAYSPKRLLKENSPQPSGRENSPIRSMKEMSPRPMLRENSPRPHNKPSTSHSQTIIGAYSPTNKGSITHQQGVGSDSKPKIFPREASPRPLPRAPLPNSANRGSGRSDRFKAWVDVVLEGAGKNVHQQEHPQDLSNYQNRHHPTLVMPTPVALSQFFKETTNP